MNASPCRLVRVAVLLAVLAAAVPAAAQAEGPSSGPAHKAAEQWARKLVGSIYVNAKDDGGTTPLDFMEFMWQARREFRDCAECPEMMVVPAGEFMMGSRSGEGTAEEYPRHVVRIRDAFAVGKYEVTFGEWDACVAGGGCEGYRPDDEGWGRGDRPVVNVAWEDAKEYVRWLSGKTGKEYRLLSEGEWEYVARAGTETRYTWGDDVGANRAHCGDCGSRWDGGKTAPVGSFGANGFGLYDVHGNVWEWVEDCWHDNYHGAPEDGIAWVTGGDCSWRVLRGGSWVYHPRDLRSANRYRFSTGFRFIHVGFRIARTLTRIFTSLHPSGVQGPSRPSDHALGPPTATGTPPGSGDA